MDRQLLNELTLKKIKNFNKLFVAKCNKEGTKSRFTLHRLIRLQYSLVNENIVRPIILSNFKFLTREDSVQTRSTSRSTETNKFLLVGKQNRDFHFLPIDYKNMFLSEYQAQTAVICCFARVEVHLYHKVYTSLKKC